MSHSFYKEDMLEVKVLNNQVEKAIRKLKRKMLREGILKELKQRQFYEKPSAKKRREHKESVRKYRKLMKRREALN